MRPTWTEFIFHLSGVLLATAPADQPALNAVVRDSRLDIKVLDNPRTVADLKAKVLTFLRAAVTPANKSRPSRSMMWTTL